MRGKLTLIQGPMFAGKTTRLIKEIAEVESLGLTYVILKPAWDTRYDGQRKLVSHSQITVEAQPVSSLDLGDIGTEYIFLDEVQFFISPYVNVGRGEIWEQVDKALDRGINVVAAGLNRGAGGCIFLASARLEALADEVIELRAKCHLCHRVATETVRINNSLPAAPYQVGGAEMYQPACLIHLAQQVIQ